MRGAVLPCLLCVLALTQPWAFAQEGGEAVAVTEMETPGSIDPEDPNFDIGAALAELRKRSVRLLSFLQPLRHNCAPEANRADTRCAAWLRLPESAARTRRRR